MPFYSWIALAAYVVGYIATWRRVLWILAYDHESDPDGDDWFLAGFIATFCSLVWPLTVISYKLYERGILQKRIARPPRAQKLRQKARELKEREAWIDQKERELKIGPYKP